MSIIQNKFLSFNKTHILYSDTDFKFINYDFQVLHFKKEIRVRAYDQHEPVYSHRLFRTKLSTTLAHISFCLKLQACEYTPSE